MGSIDHRLVERLRTAALFVLLSLAFATVAGCSDNKDAPPEIPLSSVMLLPQDVESRLEIVSGPNYRPEYNSASVHLDPPLESGFFDPFGQVADVFYGVDVFSDEQTAAEIYSNIVSSYESFDDPDCWEHWEISCCQLGDDPFEYRQTLSSGIGDDVAIFECLSYGLGRHEKPHAEYHGVTRAGRVVSTAAVRYTWGFPEQRNPDDSEVRDLLRIAAGKAKAAQDAAFVAGRDESEEKSLTCSGAIPWNTAENHVGEHATVQGPVVDAQYAADSRGQPTFLNLGEPFPDPDRFTVVIWGDDRSSFDSPPETAYGGRTICVTGTIDTYRGSPQVVVDSPDDIEVANPD